MEINVKIIKKDIIKPSSPTPNHLRIFKLSLLDQLSPAAYGSMLLVYSINKPSTAIDKSQLLKRSLSETLTRFYPLAGKIKDNSAVECNDDGAVYLEAQVDCLLSKLLEKPDDHQVIRNLIPAEHIQSLSETQAGCLLLVQATFFACGGLAIGVCISHKLADARTVCTFIQGWAAAALGTDHEAVRPKFNVSSIFPPQNLPSELAVKLNEEKCVTKRYVFHASGIATLKDKAASESVRHPTRVEAVTALIWKCAMKASRSNSKQPKMSVLAQSVNIRKKLVPPLSEYSIGNLMGHFALRATENEVELGTLVTKMRKGIQEFGENYVKKLQEGNALKAVFEALKEMGSLLHGGSTEFYITSSLCRFPFYGIDFGWGKPAWVVPPRDPIKNIISLIDARDGNGIEAWVTLKEEDMAIFERDQELLAVASLNPSVLHIIMPMSCL
ncbi:BAHD acyltransferase At5g47980 [Ricinus communis]|uniref:3'-N-debenzoyl-2'-deoxytaxol N-benzoyltransferase, putative n=1 Tax=Ricinus communis TaxID=3988 RepID=B9RML3_RICCO|nr:BAHD acyltransferase At5g47980 [Ricinus communis]EEF47536.1 3'-N-debenzoyl-2'-deoxytaxol N-benzoyltransferase, putative [Ricinus communis]|eukprot:XP_002514982.1 BAHD acyltransferase At5g47980 [Ricinus communis]